jgi:P-type Cu2+ transporter
VRNRGCLRYLGGETAIVFDKTGTITQGHFVVLQGLDELSFKEKSILKTLVCKSNHPISRALNAALNLSLAQLSSCEEFAGKGIRGISDGHLYMLGSSKFLAEQGISVPHNMEKSGIVTIVYFALSSTKVIPLFLGDELKADACEVVDSFKSSLTCLVSGDAQAGVEHVASLCKFQQWKAQASPLDKQQYIAELKRQGHIVAMIGDGINDSPALTSAHVGISVATAADVSIQVSDLLLSSDKLSILPQLRKIAQKGRRILRQNLFWAFFYNVIGIALAVFGWLSPIFAAFAMTASSLIVLLNSLRLRG